MGERERLVERERRERLIDMGLEPTIRHGRQPPAIPDSYIGLRNGSRTSILGEAADRRRAEQDERDAMTGTHGSPELDADAEKLQELGADPGPTQEELEAQLFQDRTPIDPGMAEEPVTIVGDHRFERDLGRVRCEDCRFWDTSSSLRDEEDTAVCRRHAPFAVDDRSGRAMWPYTEDIDWCAEGERDTSRDEETARGE
jgi:hypothetical protein